MRLTKFNTETNEYEYKERAKTQEEFNAQRKAVIQRLGEFEDRAEGEWSRYSTTMMECSVCKRHTARHKYEFCPHCGARMKGEKSENE